MFEPGNDVVRVSHDDHFTANISLSPLLDPEVVGVMEVDVGEQRRDHRPLRSPGLTCRQHRSLKNTGLEPLAYQSKDALVADSMFDETDQPIVVDRIEERADVGVNDPVDGFPADPDCERIQRIVLAATGSETVREAEKLLLANAVEYLDHCPLDDLVFNRRDPQWALTSIRLRNHPSPRGKRAIRSLMYTRVKLLQLYFEILAVCFPCASIDSGSSTSLQREVRPSKKIDIHMVEQSRRANLWIVLYELS